MLGNELPATFLVPCDQNSGSVCNFNSRFHFEQKNMYHTDDSHAVSQLDCTLHDQHGDVIHMNGLPWPWPMVLQMEARVMLIITHDTHSTFHS